MLNILGKALSAGLKSLSKIGSRAQKKINVNAGNQKVRYLKVRAIRDAKTCQVCRVMDGRQIKDPDQNKNFFSFSSLDKATGWGKENLIPPFHPNCRCQVEVSYKDDGGFKNTRKSR